MDEQVQAALESERTIDITTIGRKTGTPHRKEIWFHNVDGRILITGRPGRRGWYANLLANPKFTFHLKQSVRANLPATAVPIVDAAERRTLLEVIVGRVGASDFDDWVARSPLVEVNFES